jgi:CTP:molybdopterin cytidylyltransferase MocA
MTGAVASIVLAAGAGTRFGGRKQLAQLDGRPLLEHALTVAAASGGGSTYVVLGAYAEEVLEGVEFGDARVVLCEDWKQGRAASLRAGLAALPEDVDLALVMLGDEPYISPAAGHRLLGAHRPGVYALRSSYAGQPGHPVLIGRELFPQLIAAESGRKPGKILADAGIEAIACDDLGLAADIDTPADLAALARTAANS